MTDTRQSIQVDNVWGWVITGAVFFCNILCVGFFRAFGVFFVEIIENFQSSTTVTSLIMGTQSAVFCVSALLVHNVLLQVVTVRTSAMIGGCLMATGMTLAAFATSVTFLIFSLGVLVGLGNAMTYGPGLVLVGQYFERRRALAIALANTGSSVGSMVLPLLATRLLQQYGLSGAWLLYGAITYHLCVFASLYRPLQPPGHIDQRSDDKVESTRALLEKEKLEGSELPKNDLIFCTGNGVDEKVPLETNCVRCSVIENEERTSTSQTEKKMSLWAHPYISQITTDESAKTFSSTGDINSGKDSLHNGCGVIQGKRSLTVGDLRFNVQKQQSKTRSMQSLIPVTLQRRLLSVTLHASHPHLMTQSSSHTFLHQKGDQEEDSPTLGSVDTEDKAKRRSSRCGTFFEKVSCDRELLRNPVFWLVQAYVCVGVLGASGGGIYLPSLCQERGLSRDDTAIVLTWWGAANLLGRLLCGLVADRRWLRPAIVSVLAFFFIGLLFTCLRFLPDSFASMLAVAVVYGVFEGAYFTMLPLIIIDYLSLHHFSRTFGFAQLSQGAFATVIYPLLGKLRDETGDYFATFHTLGAFALIASLLLLLEPVIRALTRGKEQRFDVDSPGSS